MIITYDSIAATVTIDDEDGSQPYDHKASALQLWLYGREVVLFAEASAAGLVLGFEDEPQDAVPLQIVIVPLEARRWGFDVLPR